MVVAVALAIANIVEMREKAFEVFVQLWNWNRWEETSYESMLIVVNDNIGIEANGSPWMEIVEVTIALEISFRRAQFQK